MCAATTSLGQLSFLAAKTQCLEASSGHSSPNLIVAQKTVAASRQSSAVFDRPGLRLADIMQQGMPNQPIDTQMVGGDGLHKVLLADESAKVRALPARRTHGGVATGIASPRSQLHNCLAKLTACQRVVIDVKMWGGLCYHRLHFGHLGQDIRQQPIAPQHVDRRVRRFRLQGLPQLVANALGAGKLNRRRHAQQSAAPSPLRWQSQAGRRSARRAAGARDPRPGWKGRRGAKAFAQGRAVLRRCRRAERRSALASARRAH